MKFCRILIFFVAASAALAALAAEKPKAPAGFKWKAYKEACCEIQVPDGWFEHKRAAGATRIVRLSQQKIVEGRGADIEFTMNVVKCSNQKQWVVAMELAGQMMADARKATEHPVAAEVESTSDMTFILVEGERMVPDSAYPEKMYHVRSIVRAIPKFATIYMYSFCAPADEWAEAWKKGSVMLDPVWFVPGR